VKSLPVTVTDDIRQALKGPYVCNNTHARFADTEKRICCCHANITGADHINTATDAMTVDGGNDRFAAALDFGKGTLQGLNLTEHHGGLFKIGPGGKAFAFGFNDNHADVRIPVKVIKHFFDFFKKGESHCISTFGTI
jgi:hypothetical protein